MDTEKSIICIDFGTTNSVVCYLGRSHKPDFVLNGDKEKSELLPSYVSYNNNGEFTSVGENARRHIGNDKYYVVAGVKRILGLTYEEYKNLEGKDIFGCEVVEKNGYPEFVIGDNGETVTPINVARKIFENFNKRCKESNISSSKELDIYLSIPTGYSKNQQNAIRQAAENEGFKVIEFIQEPIGAALSYCLDDTVYDDGREMPSMKKDDLVLVYDFGGGTFDTSILKVMGDNQFEVVGHDGSVSLGGNDIDTALQHRILDKYKKEVEKEDYDDAIERLEKKKNRKKNNHDFRRSCEEAKIKAFHNPEKLADSVEEFIQKNKDFDKTIEIARNHKTKCTYYDLFEAAKPKVDETMAIIKRLLNKKNIASSAINHVIVVGGSSKVPSIRMGLRKLFPNASFPNVDTMEAVSKGMVAKVRTEGELKEKYKGKKEEFSNIRVVIEKAPTTYGLGTKFGLAVMVKKGTTLPYTCEREFTNLYPNQEKIITKIFSYNGALTDDFIDIKEGGFSLIKSLSFDNKYYEGKKHETQRFRFIFSMDSSVMTVECQVKLENGGYETLSKVEHNYW